MYESSNRRKSNFRKFKYYFTNFISEKEISSLHFEYIHDLNLDECIERLYYDRSMIQLYYNEMLFILDEENYNVDFEEFKNNFIKSSKGPYKISKSLSNFLKSLNINININLNTKVLTPLTINESLSNSKKSLFLYRKEKSF